MPPETAAEHPETPELPKKTFIYDHKLSRDPCSLVSPSFFETTGLYALYKLPGLDPKPEIAPVFATCGTTLHADIIAPTMYLWKEDVWEGDPPFAQKGNDVGTALSL